MRLLLAVLIVLGLIGPGMAGAGAAPLQAQGAMVAALDSAGGPAPDLPDPSALPPPVDALPIGAAPARIGALRTDAAPRGAPQPFATPWPTAPPSGVFATL